MKPGHLGDFTGCQTDGTVPGLKMAPKASKKKILSDTELGNPYTLLKRGMEVARPTNSVDGRGCFKKRTPAYNGQDRGLCLSLKRR